VEQAVELISSNAETRVVAAEETDDSRAPREFMVRALPQEPLMFIIVTVYLAGALQYWFRGVIT
jgi:hypothetical protein